MDLASRISRCPIAHDPARGKEAAGGFGELSPPLRDLIAGAAGCSPYLESLLRKEGAWLKAAVEAPEQALDRLIRDTAEHPPDRLGSLLRRDKRRVALLTALTDLGGVWDLMQVTQALTRFADAAVEAGLRALLGAEIVRGRLPGFASGSDPSQTGMAVLAMGKMGAGELNYSSDIDLICLFDESRFDAADHHEARSTFIRVTRRLMRLLGANDAEGYVFRTDLRLRPDPSVTPVCLGMDAAEQYYESQGRTWERAAFIKARACAGDIAAGQAFLERLRPFVWRRYLDFAAIEDAHDMRLRIRAHKGLHGPITLAGHDLKLGRGGIREIEFFTQTRQLIAGGRDEHLRVRGTLEALERLSEQGWLPSALSTSLAGDYRALREIEHRLQMLNDAQTHRLPKTPEGFARLARFMSEGDEGAFRARLQARLEEVHALTEGFFAPSHPEETGAQAPDLGGRAREIMARWPGYPALRSPRATAIFERLRPEILRRLARAARSDDALAQFDRFLAGLPAGVQLFSLFQANPHLIDLILDIVTTAPALAAHLARNPGVLDAVLAGDFFSQWPGAAALEKEMADLLAGSEAGGGALQGRPPDYERQLDAARRWAREWHFRIGVHYLRGLIDAAEAGRQYGDLARAVLAALWPVVVDEFATRHGPPPGQGAVVLGMGSLGAGRLHAASDLDLIVIYDAPADACSEGRRPLAVRPYYARLAKAFVAALGAPTAEGRLYAVDMRLRPSGRQGPVATSWAAFADYQRNKAWTWEHLALTRARPVAGNMALGAKVEAFRGRLLREKGIRAGRAARVLADVRDMRARLRQSKPGAGHLDAKLGEGHLLDIELCAQTTALLAGATARDVAGQIQAGCRSGWIRPDEGQRLLAAHDLFWALQMASRILSDRVAVPDSIGAGGRAFLFARCGVPDLDGLVERLDSAAREAAGLISGLLERLPSVSGDGTGEGASGHVQGKTDDDRERQG